LHPSHVRILHKLRQRLTGGLLQIIEVGMGVEKRIHINLKKNQATQ